MQNRTSISNLNTDFSVYSSSFGAPLPGRTFTNSDGYRYQFNGMECDPEVKGEGNSYTTEFRQYDPRLGRWLSIDPAFQNFPSQSPYVAFDNNPIFYKDPKGLAAEGGGDDKPSKKEVKSLQKSVEKIISKATKLSEKEHQQADKYAEKNGGDVFERKDDMGNARYSVRREPNATATEKNEMIVIAPKHFNDKAWSRIDNKTTQIVGRLNGIVSASNSSITGSKVPNMTGITSGVSFFGSDGFNKTEFISTFYLNSGPDKGFHQTITTSDEMYGVTYEISFGIIYGLYIGHSSDMTVGSMSGAGYQAGGDAVLGANLWWAYKGNGQVGWLGSTITVGPAIGLQFGKTDTKIRW